MCIRDSSRYYAFPIPQNGLEVVWNHITRYRGGNLRRTIVQASPQTNGAYTLVNFEEDVYKRQQSDRANRGSRASACRSLRSSSPRSASTSRCT